MQMRLGKVNLSSTDPRDRVDLKARSLEITTRLRRGIRSGKFALPEKTQAAHEWEVLDIQKLLDRPLPNPESWSVFPVKWLKARWEAVFQVEALWYPFFQVAGGGFNPNPYQAASPPIGFTREKPTMDLPFEPEPDALMAFDYVREHRVSLVTNSCKDMTKWSSS